MLKIKEQGWNYATVYSQHEHYFVDGKSLCGKFLILGYKGFETSSNPCPICMKELNKKKEKTK